MKKTKQMLAAVVRHQKPRATAKAVRKYSHYRKYVREELLS